MSKQWFRIALCDHLTVALQYQELAESPEIGIGEAHFSPVVNVSYVIFPASGAVNMKALGGFIASFALIA